MLRQRTSGCIVFAIGAAMTAIGFMSTAIAYSNATTTNLDAVNTYEDDYLYNYDFSSRDLRDDNVDWALSILFWNGADINKVKNGLNGVYSSSGGPQQFQATDGGADYFWDTDSGRKQPGCAQNTWYRHYRVYAPSGPDYFYNTGWGRYIAGTQHWDINDGCFSNPASGYSEISDGWLALDAANVWGSSAVVEDWFAADTPEPVYRFETTSNGYGHHWDQSEGRATIVRVP